MPKKRGPKTDVLEALLKRVDGLEAKLKEKKENENPGSPTTEDGPPTPVATSSAPTTPILPPKPSSSVKPTLKPLVKPSVKPSVGDTIEVKQKPAPPAVDTTRVVEVAESAVYTPSSSRSVEPKDRWQL